MLSQCRDGRFPTRSYRPKSGRGGTIVVVSKGPHLFDVRGEPMAPVIAIRDERAIEIRWETGLGLPAVSWRSGDVEVHCWWTDELHIELALGEHRPDLPAGYRIDMGWLGVFRIQASGRRGPMRCWSSRSRFRRSPAHLTEATALGRVAATRAKALTPRPGWPTTSTCRSERRTPTSCVLAREGSTLPASWEHELCALFEQPGSADRKRYPVQYLDHGRSPSAPRSSFAGGPMSTERCPRRRQRSMFCRTSRIRFGS